MLKTAMNPACTHSDHCGAGSVEKKDAMRNWLELKQNGFLSPSPSPMPKSARAAAQIPNKKRERHRSDVCSEKLKFAKVQRVDGLKKVVASASGFLQKYDPGTSNYSVGTPQMPKKQSGMRRVDGPGGALKVIEVQPTDGFSPIAPPCGLLNEFNPGIINQIRSSKQVFSAIQALVGGGDIENVNMSRKEDWLEKRCTDIDANECPNGSPRSDQLRICSEAPSGLLHVKTECEEQVDDPRILARRVANADDRDEVKSSLSSITESGNVSSSVLNGDSANTTSHPSLSIKDANAASQWLQFLRHDITRRLEALTNSRMRVQNVIQTELPALIAKEFPLNRENKNFSAAGSSVSRNVDVHKAEWKCRFDQMDKALIKEAIQLELWLNQVKEVESQNNEAFRFLNQHTGRLPQHPGISG